VRALVDGDYVPGVHQVIWDATNDQGLRVPSGIYYYRMNAESFTATKKLLLLK
jgi:flagellar hook assembly protein FlgD